MNRGRGIEGGGGEKREREGNRGRRRRRKGRGRKNYNPAQTWQIQYKHTTFSPYNVTLSFLVITDHR